MGIRKTSVSYKHFLLLIFLSDFNCIQHLRFLSFLTRKQDRMIGKRLIDKVAETTTHDVLCGPLKAWLTPRLDHW